MTLSQRLAEYVRACFTGLWLESSEHEDASSVSARIFGTLLTWMNDHESDVMVTATCNDISKLTDHQIEKPASHEISCAAGFRGH